MASPQPGDSWRIVLLAALSAALTSSASAELVRFNEPPGPGPGDVSKVQGYDFVRTGIASGALSIEPFGEICFLGDGCPSGGAPPYLGVASEGAGHGISLYPAYPTAWAPFRVHSFDVAHAPGHDDVWVNVYGWVHNVWIPPGVGLIPDYWATFEIGETFSTITVPAHWNDLGELRVEIGGSSAPPFFIDDVDATLVEPAPPDVPPIARDECHRHWNEGGAWDVEMLFSTRQASYEIESCPGEGNPLPGWDCSVDHVFATAPDTRAEFEVDLDGYVSHRTVAECGAFDASSQVHGPAYSEGYWNRSFYGTSRYWIRFRARSPSQMHLRGSLRDEGGATAAGSARLSVARAVPGGETLLELRVPRASPGVFVVDHVVDLDPGEYVLEAIAEGGSPPRQVAFDVEVDFTATGNAVPVAGPLASGALAIAVLSLGVARLARALRSVG